MVNKKHVRIFYKQIKSETCIRQSVRKSVHHVKDQSIYCNFIHDPTQGTQCIHINIKISNLLPSKKNLLPTNQNDLENEKTREIKKIKNKKKMDDEELKS